MDVNILKLQFIAVPSVLCAIGSFSCVLMFMSLFVLLVDVAQRRSLVTGMFQYYDRNSDELITLSELEYAQSVDHLEKIALVCSLTDLFRFTIGEGQSYMDSSTFMRVFGK